VFRRARVRYMMRAPWQKKIKDAIHAGANKPFMPSAKYVQLATVKTTTDAATGTVVTRPSVRTVVFRGFLEQSDRLTFVTDVRSEKIGHFTTCPWVELAWYFPGTREQFRLQGRVTVADKNTADPLLQAARIAAWNKLSVPARGQFAWPQPGLVRDDSPHGNAEFDIGEERVPDDTPLDPFCLVVLDVDQVDHLHLKTNKRFRYRALLPPPEEEGGDSSGSWAMEYVNP